ncbi:unnamed protein product [Urochloa decumbens]|uniref:Homeobox domain-containing protein n=1 Tax=Urochloa decumbens TaxID=240449 RepID=A0ABC9D1I6_9POAL
MAANVGGSRSVGSVGGAGAGGTGTAACRASGSRWTPTPEQIRILKELYYGCGIRSPNSEQIQRITAMLRQHGKIEGKNVFYWFQNHKARERQKRRLTTLDVNVVPAAGAAAAADGGHFAALSLSSPSGAPPPSSPMGFYAGNGGGGSALQLDTSSEWAGSTTMAAAETCFLQDYMGVTKSTGGHHGGSAGGAAASPWACFTSPDSWATPAPAPTTRAPETLPLFPTGDNAQPPRPRHGAPAGGRGGGGYHLPTTLPFWGAAATAATATTTTTTSVTIQQQQHHQLLQLPEQYSFYTTTGSQPPSHDASSASLELSLSSWCSPYPAGTM